ncbi:MAG TPA: hypothetical protein VFE78_29290 [Gemmataceae bacterium]|jgi:hypothetical protein|nr:hypothetical protein [Gemmataceae bacterium]
MGPPTNALTWVNVLSAVLVAAFVIMGLVTRYRDDTGAITRWGKVAVGGAAVGGVLTVTSHWLETWRRQGEAAQHQKEADANAQATREGVERAERVLLELRRVTYPIRDLIVKASAEVPPGGPGFTPYTKRVRATLHELENDAEVKRGGYPALPTGTQLFLDTDLYDPGRAPDATPRAEGLAFYPRSPLFPRRDKESVAYGLLCNWSLRFEFFGRQPPAAEGVRRPDLSFTLRCPPPEGPRGVDALRVYYGRDSGRFSLTAGDLAVGPESVRRSGKVVSIPDLHGGEMRVSWFGLLPRSEAKAPDFGWRPFAVKGLVLRVAGQEFLFDEGQLKQDTPGTYTAKFPAPD